MPALLLLAVALGLDNLAAAVGFGVGATDRISGATRLRIAVVFGLFEPGMPARRSGPPRASAASRSRACCSSW